MTVGRSTERKRDGDGFEPWVSRKKFTRKSLATQANERTDLTTRSTGVSTDAPLPQRLLVAGSLKTTSKTDEAAVKRKSTNKKSSVCKAESTLVISEKEYQLLLNLKNKSMETSSDGRESKDGRDVAVVSEEPDFLTQSLGQEIAEPEEGRTLSGVRKERGQGNRYIQEDEARMQSSPSLPIHLVDEEASLNNGKAAKKVPNDVSGEESSDSDFQRTPQKCLQSTRVARPSIRGRSKPVSSTSHEVQRQELRGQRYRNREVEFEEEEDDDFVEDHNNEGPSSIGGHGELLLQKRNPRPRNLQREDGPTKALTFFPFEEAVHRRDEYSVGVGEWSQNAAHWDTDDDFEEPRSGVENRNKMIEKRQETASEARANRKRKKVERELAVRNREAAGEKPYYILVSPTGTPYGDGMTEWKSEFNKLCRSLDPSIRDVKHQPHQKIQILKKRLLDNFEYSGVVSDKFLMPLIGHRVAARRNELMNDIRCGRDCPPIVNKEAWKRLERICDSANFQKKSTAMHYANSCRQNVGRTGPGGEIGVRDLLKRRLCRSPDPGEVQAEMNRDKGYGEMKSKMKKVAVPQTRKIPSSVSDEEGSAGKAKSLEDFHVQEVGGASKSTSVDSDGPFRNEKAMEEIDILKKMQAEIIHLKATMERHVRQSFGVAEEVPVPSTTVTTTTSPSNVTSHQD